MIKELIIHLGDRKTGSTSIQAALAGQAWKCTTAGLIYPSRWNHNYLANAIRGCNDKESLATRGQKLRQRLLQSDAEFGVISGEHFELVNPRELADFLDVYLPELRDSTRLISYIRPHADRLLSSFAERSKLGGRCGTPTQLHRNFLAKGFLIYAPRLRAWREAFGSQLTIRPFDRGLLHKGDAVEDFFSYVFRDHLYRLREYPRRNESLCLEDLVMLREVHRVLRQHFGDKLKKSTQETFGRRIGIILASSKSQGTRVRLHRALLEEIICAYRNDAIAVDQEFFLGSPMLKGLEAHRDKAIDEEQSLNPADHFSQEAIRQIHCWAEFIGRLMIENQPQFLTNSLPPEQRPKQAGNRQGQKQTAINGRE